MDWDCEICGKEANYNLCGQKLCWIHWCVRNDIPVPKRILEINS